MLAICQKLIPKEEIYEYEATFCLIFKTKTFICEHRFSTNSTETKNQLTFDPAMLNSLSESTGQRAHEPIIFGPINRVLTAVTGACFRGFLVVRISFLASIQGLALGHALLVLHAQRQIFDTKAIWRISANGPHTEMARMAHAFGLVPTAARVIASDLCHDKSAL